MKKLNLLILFILSLNLTVHAQAPIGNNLYFNGIDEYVDAGHDPKFRPGYITVEMWVNPLTLNEGDELLRNYSDNNSKGYIFTFNNNKLRFIIGENNPGSPSVTLTEGWQHIAGTWDGTWLTIYRNSVFVERKKPKNDWFYGLGTIISGPIDYGTVANPSHLRIGGGAGWLSEGRIDEVRIWNKALTQTQISAMMNYEIMNGVGGSVQLVGTSTIISGLNFCTNLNVYYQFNETNSSSKDVLDSSCKLPKLNGGYVNIDDSNIGDSDANRRYVSDTNGDWD
ncbi:MAG: LamG domain-containing protein, partial [Chlamydiia bacterium]|nr:LamG domain-containing protein [Chlamydiia bacterium]